ncbi:MAG: hypothetical protein LLG00_03800 [Planctomycetaceae bacterium]|nr:hypothetical protein [Planctomycetaceae bacterium]
MTTAFKDRLPSDMSYPVGLQTFMRDLAEVPQADILSVWFVKPRQRAQDDDYAVLTAEFQHCRLGLSECKSMSNLYEPTWRLVVYGVARSQRAVVKSLLLKQGIPEIAAWLTSPRSDTWLQGKKQMTIFFNQRDNSIVAKETFLQ